MIRLRDLLEREILKRLPEVNILFQNQMRLPNTTLLHFPRIYGESLSYFLGRKGVFVNQDLYLHRLAKEKIGESVVSFSLSRKTTEKEIFHAADSVKEVVDRLSLLVKDL